MRRRRGGRRPVFRKISDIRQQRSVLDSAPIIAAGDLHDSDTERHYPSIPIAAKVLTGALVLALSFTVSLWAMDYFWPREARDPDRLPSLAEAPPLPPVTRSSVIIAPVAIALPAIRDAIERAAPRDLTGKPDNPISKVLSKAEIGFTVARSPLAVNGDANGLTLSTSLNGALRITGQAGSQAASLGGTITSLLDDKLARKVESFAGKTLDQRADFRGNVAVTSRPSIATNWRLEPNLTGQVSIGDNSLQIAGLKLNVGKEVKPLLDKAVNEQIAALQTRLRNDPFLENAARKEWAKMCRSIPLGGGTSGCPISGSNCARPAPSPRSRASMPTR